MSTVLCEPSKRATGKLPVAETDRTATAMRLFMVVALYAVPVVVCLQPGIDWDMWWHLAVGKWIVEHAAVPVTDPFSAHGADTPWLAYSWLFEVTVFGLERAFGLFGPMIWQTLMSLAIVAAVHRLVARREARCVNAMVLTAAATLALAALFKQRPWLWTILCCTLTLDVVLDLRAGRRNRLTWVLPILFVLWANIHIQFVYGLFLLGLACVAPWIDGTKLFSRELQASAGHSSARPRRAAKRWTLLLLCILATLVNPYHMRLYGVVWEYATQPGPFRFVNELKAPEFRELTDWVVLLLGAAAVFALGRRQRLSSFEVVLLIVAGFLAFRARRDLWFLVIAALAILTNRGPRETLPRDGFSFTWPRAAFIAAAVALVTTLTWGVRGLGPERMAAAIAEVFPVEAVEEVRERGCAGPLFNDFDWGGYLIWNLPELPVLVDGRTNLHGDERLSRIGAAWNGAPEWRHDPDLAVAGVVIANARTPLAELLETDSRFKRVHHDSLAKVFVARHGGR